MSDTPRNWNDLTPLEQQTAWANHGGQQPQPPKKSHTVRNVMLGITGAFVILFGGCAVLVGGAAVTLTEAVEQVEATQSAKADAAETAVDITDCSSDPKDVLGMVKIHALLTIRNTSGEDLTFSVEVPLTDANGVKAGTLVAYADVKDGATYTDQLDTYAEEGAVGPFTCEVPDIDAY